MAALLLSIAFVLVPGCGDPSGGKAERAAEVQLAGRTMGTVYSVKIADALPAGSTPESVQAEIDSTLETVNDLMSTYREDSEISRFNRAPADEWFPVSDATAGIVLEAIALSEWTGGAFDVTAGPLVNAWNFGPGERTDTVPSARRLAEAMQAVGYLKLEARTEGQPALRKGAAALYVDLSAIAKGYAVDRVAAQLEQAGMLNYLVDIGGELRAGGSKADGTPWTIGIEVPDPAGRQAGVRLQLTDTAVATSGDYRNYFEADGRKYAHIIDPRTGQPTEGELASATVVKDNCQEADALATSLMVMGSDAALRFADDEGLAVLLVARDDDGFRELRSRAFVERFGRQGETDE